MKRDDEDNDHDQADDPHPSGGRFHSFEAFLSLLGVRSSRLAVLILLVVDNVRRVVWQQHDGSLVLATWLERDGRSGGGRCCTRSQLAEHVLVFARCAVGLSRLVLESVEKEIYREGRRTKNIQIQRKRAH